MYLAAADAKGFCRISKFSRASNNPTEAIEHQKYATEASVPWCEDGVMAVNVRYPGDEAEPVTGQLPR
jgi:hypothetical protein